jgi:hypothetical protein
MVNATSIARPWIEMLRAMQASPDQVPGSGRASLEGCLSVTGQAVIGRHQGEERTP